MYRNMEMWTVIRRRVLTEQCSKRAICREYGIHWKTLQKILRHEEPPPFQQRIPRAKPKLGQFLPIIHEILKADCKAPKKQRHTAKRIFERLRAEHGYNGGYTVVKDAVRAWRNRQAEVFVPLSHRPGEAQADFGEVTPRWMFRFPAWFACRLIAPMNRLSLLAEKGFIAPNCSDSDDVTVACPVENANSEEAVPESGFLCKG